MVLNWVKCRPPAPFLTGGQAADSPLFTPVLRKIRARGPVTRLRTRPDAAARDKAYSSRANCSHLRIRQMNAVIPEKEDRAATRRRRRRKGPGGGRPVSHDADLYKERSTVERLINKLKGMARHRHQLLQKPGELPRRTPPPRPVIWIKDLTRST